MKLTDVPDVGAFLIKFSQSYRSLTCNKTKTTFNLEQREQNIIQ